MKNRLLLILLLLVAGVCDGQIITTVAGNGSSGSGGDGGAAATATLARPSQIVLDAFGNIYISEVLNNKIRKINSLGIITTIAGNGLAGYNGDGIVATAAKLNSPSDIKVDASGNLYIADGNNHRIRKVNNITGVISTIAGNGVGAFAGDGGQATASSLNYPGHISFDDNGNMFISDVENRRIRKVSPSGVISTVAGNGILGYSGDGGLATAAEINSPHGLACDAYQNLYIADGSNARVRKVDNTTGIISTFAGNGTFTYNGDEIQATTAEITPQGIAFDKYGNLYIADAEGFTFGNRIRMVDISGIIHTVAGNGMNGFGGDGGLAMSAKLSSPWDVAIDSCGDLYIADANNQRIRKVTYPKCHYLQTENIPQVSQQLSIYPTPTNDLLHINNLQTPATYKLLNMPGAVLQQGTLKAGDNSISIETLPVGMYMLEVVNAAGGVREVRKVVKQ